SHYVLLCTRYRKDSVPSPDPAQRWLPGDRRHHTDAGSPAGPSAPYRRTGGLDGHRRWRLYRRSAVVAVAAAVVARGAGIGVVVVGPHRGPGAPRPGPSAPAVAAPRLVLRLPATIPLRGRRPHLAWPVSGQAAVTIPGIGSLGTSGPVRTPQPIASLA